MPHGSNTALWQTTMTECIPPNPDISGIGVRIAIYAQNFLCFLPVVVHLWDGTISTDELDGIKDQSIGMLAIAFAILISTIVQAKSGGNNPTITNYHAAIVLDLSWINNTSTWIWFILFVHNRTENKIKRVPATWWEWYRILREPLVELFTAPSGTDYDTSWPQRTLWARLRFLWAHVRDFWVRIWNLATKQFVLTLGSLHLSVMAAIGLWLWSNPTLFGSSLPSGCDPTLTIIGHGVLFSSRPLRIVSLTMYSLVLIPGVNLVLPFLFFLSLHIGYNHGRVAYNRLRGHAPPSTRTHFLIAGLAFLVLFNAFFVVDIEKTLQHNKGNQTGEDNEWGFGQVLALLLLVVPLRDAWSALQNIRSKLRGVQGQFEDLFRRECEATPIVDELEHLIRNEADPKREPTSWRCLELAACYGKEGLVQFLQDKQVSLDARGGDYGTALCAACANGKTDMLEYLLRKGADLTLQGPFGAPLHVAVLAGELDIVKLLVEGDENRQNEADCVWDPFGTAIDVGTVMRREEAVNIMRSKGLREGSKSWFGL
ncbi:hypothetical protein DFH06DRAFT_1200269, partial [Mycena polygramma]